MILFIAVTVRQGFQLKLLHNYTGTFHQITSILPPNNINTKWKWKPWGLTPMFYFQQLMLFGIYNLTGWVNIECLYRML